MYWSAGSSHSGIRAAEYITVANIFWLWNALACNAFLFFLTRNVEGLTYVGGMLQSCKYGVTYRDKKKNPGANTIRNKTNAERDPAQYDGAI